MDEATNYQLRLYVAGNTFRSLQAIETVRSICERCLKGHYSLQVIDLQWNPDIARQDQVMALPTLVRLSPVPIMRVVGDMSRVDRVLRGLEASAGIRAEQDGD